MHPSTSKMRLGAALLLYLGVGLGSGCSRQAEFGEVQGTVTLSGKPLAGVVVTFYPETIGNESAPSARGKTDAAGNYALTTDGKAGALVGKHRVVVKWPLAERVENWDKAPHQRPLEATIPRKYTVAADTPLIFEVKAGAPQTIDLVLRP
jgi:hypothetical protein